MQPKHIFLAILTMAIWGSNFVAIKLSYESFTPFLQLSLRFLFSVFPFIFFVKKPNCSWALVIRFAIFMWLLQLSAMGMGLYMGMPPGLCALLMQTQAIFTLILSILIFNYKPRPMELVGIFMAFVGISIIVLRVQGEFTWVAFLLVILAAFSVGVGNLLFKGQKQDIDMPAVVVWSCLIPPIPMFMMSFAFEGWDAICLSCSSFTWTSFAAVVYTAVFSTVIATILYANLLKRYEPAQVVPYMMLSPIFGSAASYFILGEPITQDRLIAALFIIGGLFLNQFSQPQEGAGKVPLKKAV